MGRDDKPDKPLNCGVLIFFSYKPILQVPHFPNQFFLFWSYSPSLVAGHIQVVQACMNVMAMRPLARNAERNRNVMECRNVLQKCFKKKLLVVGILGVLVPWTGSTWSWSKETTSQSSGSWRCSTTCFEKTAVVALCHGFRWVSTGHPCLKLLAPRPSGPTDVGQAKPVVNKTSYACWCKGFLL